MTRVSPGRATSSRLRSGLVYAAAAGVQRASIFLLLPFVTRVMPPAEYGRLSVVLSAAAAASILFAGGLDVAVFRTFFQLARQPAEQRRYVDSLWAALLVLPSYRRDSSHCVLLPIVPLVSIRAGELALGMLGAALFVSASTVPMAVLRAEERSAATSSPPPQ